MKHFGIAQLVVLAALVQAAPSAAQEHEHGPGEQKLGTLRFPTSCNAAAQPVFERGVAMLHSFWFGEAEHTFREAMEKDPACGMPYWGVAMVKLGNPLAGRPSAETEKIALEAAERAATLGAPTARERGYIDAVRALYGSYDQVDYRQRMRAYEESMAKVVAANPDDSEAAIFHSLAVIANAQPTDLTFERQKKAAGVLTPLFVSQPQHPGLAHYIIHAYDSPALAQYALDAAQRYAEIAPAAPHALHMPSHIFTRLGLWDQSIEMNRRSANAETSKPGRYHPFDYMVYAYLQQGRDNAAKFVVNEAMAYTGATPAGYTATVTAYNLVAMPARYALERSQWSEAAQLVVPGGEKSYPHAITHFARAIGAARSGNAVAARQDIVALKEIQAGLEQRKDAYWAGVVNAQQLAASAWAAYAEGNKDEALRLAMEAARLEDTFEKHPVTPGPILPARELLGDMLLELGKPAEASAAYEATLKKEPNRARALRGAGFAAAGAGNALLARERLRQYVVQMERAEGAREVQSTRTLLNQEIEKLDRVRKP